MEILLVVIGIIVLYLLLLAWAAHLDRCYFSDGAPGQRPLAQSWTKGDGVYIPGPPPAQLRGGDDD